MKNIFRLSVAIITLFSVNFVPIKVIAQTTCSSFTDEFTLNLNSNWEIPFDGEEERVSIKDGKLILTDIDPGPLQAVIDTESMSSEKLIVSVDVEAFNSALTADGTYSTGLSLQIFSGDITPAPNYYTNTKFLQIRWHNSIESTISAQVKGYTLEENNPIKIGPATTVEMKIIKDGSQLQAFANDVLVGEVNDFTDEEFTLRIINGEFTGSSAQTASARLDNFKLTCGETAHPVETNEVSADTTTNTTLTNNTAATNNTSATDYTNTILLVIVVVVILIVVGCMAYILSENRKKRVTTVHVNPIPPLPDPMTEDPLLVASNNSQVPPSGAQL